MQSKTSRYQKLLQNKPIQKRSEAAGDFTGNKNTNKITGTPSH